MRVFLGLTEIAGYYHALHRGLREIGIDSVYACGGHLFAYAESGAGPNPWPVRLFRKVSTMRLAVPRPGRPIRAVLKVLSLLSRIPLLVWALFKCDVFVFGFGSYFFTPRELALFRLLGKRTIHVFHGSDNRPCYMDGAIMQPERMKDVTALFRYHRRQHQHVKLIENYSDCLVTHPATAQYFERPYVNWLLATGVPFAGEGGEPAAGPAVPDRPVRILHCPSNPGTKGTEFIRGLIRRLKSKGHCIDYREIINRPNADVLAELRECDFVIDQAYADYPMAGFATEAANFGKPAVVGGYAQEICAQIEQASGMPCDLYCLPEDMEELSERLILDPDFRRQCGRKAKTFVASAWSRRAISQRWQRLLKGDVPEGWIVQPEQVNYVRGIGLTPDGLQQERVTFSPSGGRRKYSVFGTPRRP